MSLPITGFPKIKLVEREGPNLTVEFTEPVPASLRGTMLMDYEDYLRSTGIPDAIVWAVPLGDRNSLRNLRGIEVKT